jgi:hypothetical protein
LQLNPLFNPFQGLEVHVGALTPGFMTGHNDFLRCRFSNRSYHPGLPLFNHFVVHLPNVTKASRRGKMQIAKALRLCGFARTLVGTVVHHPAESQTCTALPEASAGNRTALTISFRTKHTTYHNLAYI